MHTGGSPEGRGEGVTACTPSKGFEKLDRKNIIKHENRGFPPNLLTTPSKELENDCASMIHFNQTLILGVIIVII
jgi:hypothetical protein